MVSHTLSWQTSTDTGTLGRHHRNKNFIIHLLEEIWLSEKLVDSSFRLKSLALGKCYSGNRQSTVHLVLWGRWIGFQTYFFQEKRVTSIVPAQACRWSRRQHRCHSCLLWCDCPGAGHSPPPEDRREVSGLGVKMGGAPGFLSGLVFMGLSFFDLWVSCLLWEHRLKTELSEVLQDVICMLLMQDPHNEKGGAEPVPSLHAPTPVLLFIFLLRYLYAHKMNVSSPPASRLCSLPTPPLVLYSRFLPKQPLSWSECITFGP